MNHHRFRIFGTVTACCAGFLLSPAAEAGQTDFTGPPGTFHFGGSVKVLPNGNFVVVDEAYIPPGMNVRTGGVFLYSAGGTLISTLTGSQADDRVGSGGITVLANGNFVVESYRWDNGTVVDAGAVTWGSMTTGVSGVVSPANSLVGSLSNDQIGDSAETRGQGGIIALSNGNYVVCSPTWDNGFALKEAGAVTWGDGTKGVTGVISAANSLVGTAAGTYAGVRSNGGGVTLLSGGNYVLSTPFWKNGAVAGVGAVTWCSGATGRTGAISADNSLVGSVAGDNVGGGRAQGKSIVLLSDGNYIVASPNWNRGAMVDAGAVTWCAGDGSTTGPVTEMNSLVGATASDKVSGFEPAYPGLEGIIALKNGNYAVASLRWDKGAVVDVGAVTWCAAGGGATGPVTEANSVTGSTAGDMIGRMVALSSGDYVVAGEMWDNGSVENAGAVRLMSGAGPSSGVLTPGNSLVGTQTDDRVSSAGLTALTNGNFVVASPRWGKGALARAGAVTWVSGAGGLTGPVTVENSLTGSGAGNLVGGFLNSSEILYGGRVTALTNGNYVVASPFWSDGNGHSGAVTWGNGTTGLRGTVTPENSIVGDTSPVRVGGGISDLYPGGVTALANGNYVVGSPLWDNGAVRDAGALTWASGTAPTSLVVSAANSLVGSTKDQYLGAIAPSALPDGGYVLLSPELDNGALLSSGALFYSDGTKAVAGVLSAENGIIGAAANGGQYFSFAQDPAGKRLLVGASYDNHLTFITTGTVNAPELSLERGDGSAISAGTTVDAGEMAVGATKVINLILRNPGYADLNLTSVTSPDPRFTVALPAGGVTLARGESLRVPVTFTSQQSGSVSAVIHFLSNDPETPDLSFTVTASVSGSSGTFTTDIPGPPGSGRFGREVFSLPNGNVVVTDPYYDAPGPVEDVGAVYLYSASGALISTLTGSSAGDFVGDGGVAVLANGNFVVRSASWRSEGVPLAGAATWGSGVTGVSGTVSAANSLVGSSQGDDIGAGYSFHGRPGIIPLPNGNYVVLSPVWNKYTGAATWGNGSTGTTGVVSAANSIIGGLVGDSGLTILSNGNCVVTSSLGATWISATTGAAGQISAANSLMAPSNDGTPISVQALSDGNYAIVMPGFNAGVGAVAWGNGTTGTKGTVQFVNALYGGIADNVGSGGVTPLPGGAYAVLSPKWSENRGAVTWCGAGGVTIGAVSGANSLIGSQAQDAVGREGLVLLTNGNCVVASRDWANGPAASAGAVTWSSGSAPAVGPISSANSLIGTAANDQVGATVAALDDGNYVVGSGGWNQYQGAITWGNGATGRTGPVSVQNSLVGLSPGQGLGLARIIALKSGAYAFSCPAWKNQAGAVVGAVSWMSGTTDGAGIFNPANAITGSGDGDVVGSGGIQALPNGHFVILSPDWSSKRGAVTWADGFQPPNGVVSAANSLVGSTSGDVLGSTFKVLPNGNYLVGSPHWSNGPALGAGAVTFGDGQHGVSGVLSAANSIVGRNTADSLGAGGNPAYPEDTDGFTVWEDSAWADNNNGYKITAGLPGTASRYGAVILGDGRASDSSLGAVDRRNSVRGEGLNTGSDQTVDYFPGAKRWVVGLPNDNMITFFSYTSPAQRRISLEQPGGIALSAGSTVDFGWLDAGQSADRTVTIVNRGGDSLHPGVLNFSDPQFKVLTPPALSVLPPNSRTDFVIRFTPASAGLKSATLQLASDDPDQAVIVLNLRGTARPAAAAPFGDGILSPEITAQPDGKTSLRFQAVPGITYLLQRSSDLVTWSFSSLVTADAAGSVVFLDDGPRSPSAFYRLKAR